MRPQSAKAKGRRLQQWMCELIIQKLSVAPEDCRSCSMGAGGEDIKLSAAARAKFPYSVECKNTESLNVWRAFQQCEANAPAGAQPLVCIKRNSMRPLVVLDADHFVGLVAKANKLPVRETPLPLPLPPAPPPSLPIAKLEPRAIDVIVSQPCSNSQLVS